jgi:hypothetical protein
VWFILRFEFVVDVGDFFDVLSVFVDNRATDGWPKLVVDHVAVGVGIACGPVVAVARFVGGCGTFRGEGGFVVVDLDDELIGVWVPRGIVLEQGGAVFEVALADASEVVVPEVSEGVGEGVFESAFVCEFVVGSFAAQCIPRRLRFHSVLVLLVGFRLLPSPAVEGASGVPFPAEQVEFNFARFGVVGFAGLELLGVLELLCGL